LACTSSFGYGFGEKRHKFSDGGSLKEAKSRKVLRYSELYSWLYIVAKDGEGEETHGYKSGALSLYVEILVLIQSQALALIYLNI
jgi:hypothetical protein